MAGGLCKRVGWETPSTRYKEMLKHEPPVDYVRHGAVSLPIRRSPVKALIRDPAVPRGEGEPPVLVEKVYDSFYVDARIVGRGRIRAATIQEAKQKGLPVAKEIAKEGEAAIHLLPEERRIYIIAKKALTPYALAVDEGARRLAEILKQLNGEPFEKVFQVYNASSQKLKLGAKTPEVYEHYLNDQQVVRGNTEYHIRDVERWVGRFAKAFPGEIIPITTDQIDSWLKGLGGKARSKNNARDHVIAFFNFAQQKDYLPKSLDHAAVGTSPFNDARKKITTEEGAKESIEDIEFYLPDEMRRLLIAAPLRIRPSFELKAFSGVRTEEMIRFWWVFIKEVEKIIHIPKEIAKLKFRTIPILDNLQIRLAAYDQATKQGRVCKDWGSANSLYHAWLRVCKDAGVPYKKNAFRDSYITYRVALTNDPKLVAMESGNSEKMIRENYLHLATKEQAQEWFSL
jgi:integrase